MGEGDSEWVGLCEAFVSRVSHRNTIFAVVNAATYRIGLVRQVPAALHCRAAIYTAKSRAGSARSAF